MKWQPILIARCSTVRLAVVLATLVGTLSLADEPRAANESDDPIVHILDWEDTQELVQSEYRGRVVVANLWTNTCPTCLEGFPEFADLQDRFDKDDFACISLNCDYDGIPGKPPEYYRSRVVEFLKRQRAGIDHVMLSDPLLDFMEEVELNSTPALFVFDRDGNLVQRFDNDQADSEEDEFTLEQVEATVRELLE